MHHPISGTLGGKTLSVCICTAMHVFQFLSEFCIHVHVCVGAKAQGVSEHQAEAHPVWDQQQGSDEGRPKDERNFGLLGVPSVEELGLFQEDLCTGKKLRKQKLSVKGCMKYTRH